MKSLASARRQACLSCAGAQLLSAAPAIRFATGRPIARRGVTLIELMVALAITMIMMTAVITLFANVTGTVTNSRALVEISERLRTARNRLQLDLVGHTASTIPPLRPEDGEGYLEIIEGPNNDWASQVSASPSLPNGVVPNPINGTTTGYSSTTYSSTTANDIMGDADDVLMLTVRSQGDPFVGWGYNTTTLGPALMESNTAEVIWYAVPNGRSLPGDTSIAGSAPVQLYTLYRRVLLVAPTLVPSGAAAMQFTTGTPTSIATFYNQYDLSVRSVPGPLGPNIAVGNSLADLTDRKNRFLHAFALNGANAGIPIGNLSGWPQSIVSLGLTPALGASSFPYPVQQPSYISTGGASPLLTSLLVAVPAGLMNITGQVNQRLGEDVILTDVLAFDIRVFDPTVPLFAASSTDPSLFVPSDPGYQYAAAETPPTVAGFGAFVDLGYGNLPTNAPAVATPKVASHFSAYPNAISATNPQTASKASAFSTNASYVPQTYDTFSFGYERDHFDEDESPTGTGGMIDQGTDGLDNDPSATPGTPFSPTDGIVDSPPQIAAPLYNPGNPNANVSTNIVPGSITAGELETLPPYPFPLRGVQIKIRVYEPDTRQVREVTVVQDFLPD